MLCSTCKKQKINYIKQTVLATLLQIYPCLFCNVKGKIKISVHLKKEAICKEQYFHLFKCENIENVSSQVKKIKALSYSCRQKGKRSLEYQEQKEGRKSKILTLSEESYLNLYYISTSFTNTYKCSVCKLHFQESNVRKLRIAEYPNFALDRINRRYGFYFICRKCESNPLRNIEPVESCPKLQISKEELDDFVLYKVSLIQEGNDIDNDDDNDDDNNDVTADVRLNNSFTGSNAEYDPNLALEELINQIPSSNEHGGESEDGIGSLTEFNPTIEYEVNVALEELIHQIPSSNEHGGNSEGVIAMLPHCQLDVDLGKPLKYLFRTLGLLRRAQH